MYSRVPPPTVSQTDPKAAARDKESEEKTDQRPEGVPDRLWLKFQALRNRRQQVTKRSTEKRIRDIQKQALDQVEAEMVTPEERSILHSHQVALSGSCSTDACSSQKQSKAKRSGKRKLDGSDQTSRTEEMEHKQTESDSGPDLSGEASRTGTSGWMEVKPFLSVNDHLKGIDKGRHAPKSKLEEKVDCAIRRGEYKTAEELSDQLATREFGKKISDAFEAKRYTEKQKAQEATAKAKKKKKLHWGFDHKQRWETKGNM